MQQHLVSNIKINIQRMGRFLSNMVMPNIGAFIAWGLITALFIPTGWFPQPTLATLVGPMLTYLLPLLIGYTGGRLLAGERGGVVGAITTTGVIIGSDIPMLLGAMIAGPLGGWCIKQVDGWFAGKTRSGFEMLVNNFSAGIVGMLLAIVAFLLIGPTVDILSSYLAHAVNGMVQHNMLPLVSIFVEPAKVLFLNNAINHGIFSPLGIQQVSETGKSIFFLIEANPGPGLGVLLAYLFFGKGSAKQSAPGAVIIQFFGGIHEIYFPYILMNPRLFLAVILGGMSGVFILSVFHAGLVAPASPGSIFAVLLMTPESSLVGVVLAVVGSAAVSFLVSSVLLKHTHNEQEEGDDLAAANTRLQQMKTASTPASQGEIQGALPLTAEVNDVKRIFVACDAGMGSSAMGASLLRKTLHNAGIQNISVHNCAINDLPLDADIVITHQDLTARARQQVPLANHLSLRNFMDSTLYNTLASQLASTSHKEDSVSHIATTAALTTHGFTLEKSAIFLNLHAENKEHAIRFAGQQLVEGGYVTADYVDAMLEREKLSSTYLGESIAVPHGTIEAKQTILKTGIVLCQYPAGVYFGPDEHDIAHLVIGIAAKNNEHMQVLTQLTNALDDAEIVRRLQTTQQAEEVLALLTR